VNRANDQILLEIFNHYRLVALQNMQLQSSLQLHKETNIKEQEIVSAIKKIDESIFDLLEEIEKKQNIDEDKYE
jgi:hypothetical protein